MIIIGEKINGTIPSIKKAIQQRDEDFIQKIAIKQVEAGAHYIDVCASTEPLREGETLKWLMEIVQDVVDVPLCIDSPNVNVIESVFGLANKPGLINSVSEEGNKCEIIYPLIEGTEWQVIGLTCDDRGIPYDAAKKVEIAISLVEKAAKHGITPDRIHIDPLVMALSTENKSMCSFTETTKQVKSLYPKIKITSGLSNISFGMPARKIVNVCFMVLAIYAGMDSAILDPLDKKMMGAIFATEALMGEDRFCRKYNSAYRQGKFGSK